MMKVRVLIGVLAALVLLGGARRDAGWSPTKLSSKRRKRFSKELSKPKRR
jgi:hypothetical protein